MNVMADVKICSIEKLVSETQETLLVIASVLEDPTIDTVKEASSAVVNKVLRSAQLATQLSQYTLECRVDKPQGIQSFGLQIHCIVDECSKLIDICQEGCNKERQLSEAVDVLAEVLSKLRENYFTILTLVTSRAKEIIVWFSCDQKASPFSAVLYNLSHKHSN